MNTLAVGTQNHVSQAHCSAEPRPDGERMDVGWMELGPRGQQFYHRDHIPGQHSSKYNNPKFKFTILGHYKGLSE